MLGHAIIFEGIHTFADIELLECQAFNTAFFEAGLPWIWDRQIYRDFGDIEDGQERIRLYAMEMNVEMTCLDTARLHRDVIRYFTGRASRFGVSLQPGVEHMIARARKFGSKVGLVSRHALAPTIRLYNGSDLKIDALGPDVAAVTRVLDVAEIKVIGSGDRLRLVETILAQPAENVAGVA